MKKWYGGIEAGGTKFVCAVASDPGTIRAETRFPTTTPEETLGKAIAFFKAQAAEVELISIGIAAFGPLDPTPTSPSYGYITTTPKPHWANTDFVGAIQSALNVPVGFDTDVNGAALGEYRWGAGQGLDTFVYFTIGTGVGGGGMVGGKLMHGLVHPEMGHMMLQQREGDTFAGICPYHGNCFEGLACGPAVEARWGVKGQELGVDHPAWEVEADTIARALHNIVMVLSPQRIILGGGVMGQTQLFPMIRKKLHASLNGYVQSPAILTGMDDFVVPPGLGDRAGVLGAIALGMDA
jgi:fructokinase